MKYDRWIFDMDGTLTDSMGLWDEAPFALLRRFGREARPGLRETLLPMGMAETARYMIREYALPLDEAGFDDATRRTMQQLYRTAELKPGVRRTLERLRAEGARLCVCSNTWREVCEEVLTRLEIRSCFDFVLTAEGGWTKRKPDIFLEAMRRLGGTDPARCVVCEDAVYAVRTARQAGFGVIGVADFYSRADAAEMERLCGQFLNRWEELDWSRV